MKALLSPLQRLGNLMEEQNKKIEEIHSVLTIDLKKAAVNNSKQLEKQTELLGDIKKLLELSIKQDALHEKRRALGGRFRLRMPKFGAGIASVGFAVISMAAALVLSAGFFSRIEKIDPWQLLSALGVALALTAIVPAYVLIAKAVRRLKVDQILAASIVLPLLAGGLVATAHVFQKLAGVNFLAPDPKWAYEAGLAMLAFSASFYIIAQGLKGASIQTALMAAVAIPVIAGAIILTGLIFGYGDQIKAWNAPPLEWTKLAGAALLLFAIPFAILAVTTKSVGWGDLFKAAASVPLIAAGLLATAWILSYLPEASMYEGKAPSKEWVTQAGIAIGLFAIPFLLIGFIAQSGGGAAALGLGLLGIILIAASMFVVAWIFSALPDLGSISENFTNAIMHPVNAMIDSFVRLKEEVGIENLMPLAGGLFAIAGGWLALVAAMAGGAVGGLYSSVANTVSSVFDAISGALGGEDAKTPFDLLNLLADKSEAIIAMEPAFTKLGTTFMVVSNNVEGMITGMAAILPFTENRKSNNLKKSSIAMDKIATAYQKVAKASKVMNVDAINASARMFEAIADIAKNDGEDAMTVLAKKLMEAVEKLSETVKDLEDTTSGSSNDIRDAVSGAIENFTKKIMGERAEGDTNTGMLDMSIVVAAIQELEARFDRPIQIEDSAAF